MGRNPVIGRQGPAYHAADIPDEFLGGGTLAMRRGRRGAPALRGSRRLAALALHLALGLSVHSRLGSVEAGRAGQEGIEPPTAGFGDRCSAN